MRTALIEARKNQSLSQLQVAEKVGISRSHYSNIEIGLRNPDYGTAKKISLAVKKGLKVIFSDFDCFRLKSNKKGA